jgi:hypothetical protein
MFSCRRFSLVVPGIGTIHGFWAACFLSLAVLFVADLLQPLDDFAVERFLNRDMGHGRALRFVFRCPIFV